MGRFEIIIVIVGLVWTIASAIMQKKAKAAKAARLKAIAEETSGEYIEDESQHDPASVSDVELSLPGSKPQGGFLSDRLAALREQIQQQMSGDPVGAGRSMLEAAREARSLNTGQSVGATTPPPPPEPAPAAQRDPAGAVETHFGMDAGTSLADGQEPGSVAMGLREILADRNRIREAFLLKEILDPPIALR